jgi:aminoglycoside/choline kinase family phosphotransferase
MTDRTALISSFLKGSKWENWTRNPLAGDASARRYLRLTDGPSSAILMDADPATGQNTATFVSIGDWLTAQHLSPPQTLLHDPNNGLLLLEDLGAEDFAIRLQNDPRQATTLYTAATDVLATLDTATPPSNLTRMTPDVGGEMLQITAEWYGDPKQTQIADEMADHMVRLCPVADKIALRDFHAENLIWRPDRTGSDRVGLLDYQDAFVAPRGYDLVSLLRDVRRVVNPELASSMIDHFIVKTGANPGTLPAALSCLAVQRNLRILGVFARLALRDGKKRYINMIPHVWDMIQADLKHPELKNLKKCVEQTLPKPENATIKDLL